MHQQTPGFIAVNLLRAELADDPHSVGSLNHVHLVGLVLFPVSLTRLHLTAQVQLPRAKVASASVTVHIDMQLQPRTLDNFQCQHATIQMGRLNYTGLEES